MHQISETILKKYQTRRKRKQKDRFLQYMLQQFPEARIEKSWGGKNLILGDVRSADILLTAHYDTCAQMLVPNFITPYNQVVYILYQLLILLPFILIGVAAKFLFAHSGSEFLYIFALPLAEIIAITLLLLMVSGPIPNKNTANDNTSGVITLIEIYTVLTPEQRKRVCLVFFDNEENGVFGSCAFFSKHKKDGLDKKLLLNFDCVSEGGHILLTGKKKAVAKYKQSLESAFTPTETMEVNITHKAVYPSDQASFPNGIGVAALRKHKRFGWMLDKVHTKYDTVFQQENISYLKECTLRLLENEDI